MAQETDIIRIALIGPESTAKSTLSEGLAKYYKTIWIQEYAVLKQLIYFITQI